MLRTGSNTTRALSVFFAFFLLVAGILTSGCGSGGGGGGGLQNEVRGIVRDSANNDAPVGGATVTIGGKSATTTAPDGSFVIRGASLGSSTATVTVPGQPAQTIAFEPPVGPTTVDGLILTLNIGQIRGRVLLANQPVEDALVTEIGTAFPVATNADGTFLLESIPAGATSVVAVAGGAAKTVNVNVVNGLNDIGDIVLENDPNTDPPGVPAGTIVGKITLADQTSPTAGAGTLVFLLRNGVQIDQALTNPNGEFQFFALPGGGYSLLVRKSAYADKQSDVFEITNPSVPLRKDLTLDLN